MKYIKKFENKKPEKEIEYYDNGDIRSISYKLDDEFHKGILSRKDGPAYQSWYNNGQITTLQYVINGNLHREDGPAYQYYDINGNKLQEIYYINGKYHRKDGPAKIYWSTNGKKEIYYIDNKRHREDGPALIFYNKNKIISEYYFLNNFKYDKKEWINKLKEIKSPHYEEQKILYDMEKYNL